MTLTAPAPRAPARRTPVAPRWWSDVASVAAGTTLLVVTALWVRGGGVQQLTAGAASAATAGGRLTGLWSADLLLLQVLLLARIPVAERTFGQDRLTHWHRWVGFASCWLMLAHIVLIGVGDTGGNPLPALWEMVVDYPGVLLATGGTVALLLVVFTSVRAARRRLRYESWHLLHLYAYVGVGLALPHELWAGGDFLSSRAATFYWCGFYAVVAGAVLLFRILVPVWRNLRHRLVVDHVAAEGHDLTSVYLRGRRLDRLPVRAGQFFLWRFLDGPGWSRAHPYSLSATPQGDLLRITVKALGGGSRRVGALQPGTRALIEGPYGKLTGATYAGGPLLLLACGIGITPLIALLGELRYRPGEATLIYRARNQAELAFREELDWFAAHRGVRIVPVLGSRARVPSWLPAGLASIGDAEVLRRIAPDVTSSEVYVCGPDAWTVTMRAAARQAGVPVARLHTEKFAW
jgi:predicted ferric reductase